MAFNLPPWLSFEFLSDTDKAANASSPFLGVSDDRKTVTITGSSGARQMIQYTSACRPLDVLEFSVDVECTSGSMACGIQVGTSASILNDVAGKETRCMKKIDPLSCGGFKTYRMKLVVPETTSGWLAMFWVGAPISYVGVAKYRNPKMKINGVPVGAPFTGTNTLDVTGGSRRYSAEALSSNIDFTAISQQSSTRDIFGNPLLMKVGQAYPNKKFIGTDGSLVAICNFSHSSGSTNALRFLSTGGAGPGIYGETPTGIASFIDCFCDNGTEHFRVGKINFYYQTDDNVVFSITTPDLEDNEDRNGLYIWKSGTFSPRLDNVADCGSPAHRWANVRAVNGTIQTSDIRAKDNLEKPSDALMRAWGKVSFKVFQMRDAIAEKGANKARLHIGVIAQEVQAAFASEGLDASRYGLFCYDEWEDVYETETVVDVEEHVDAETGELVPAQTHTERRLVRTAGNLYGIRYEEALALECAYQRWLGEKRDTRIAELEARLNEISGNGTAPSGASPDNL